MNPNPLSTGDLIEVAVESIAYGGDGVARCDGLVIFVPLAAPGDRLRVRVVDLKKRHARAEIAEILVRSPFRRQPACRYFGDCGGCQLQHLDYASQLQAKIGFIRDSLARVGRIAWDKPIEIRSAAEFAYRSRARVQIDSAGGKMGFRRAQSRQICDLEECPILVPELNRALELLRANLKPADVSPRLTEVEVAAGGGHVSSSPPLNGLSADRLEEKICGKIYRFGPGDFFQSNVLLVDHLVQEVVAAESGKLALDLYCGVGLFTVPLADSFEEVIGIEHDPDLVAGARENVRANRAANVRIVCERVGNQCNRLGGTSPDLLVLDPPRTGAAEAVPLISTLKPRRICYVSCDPVTLARDLRRLLDEGFVLDRLRAFDLFPQSYHVETVAHLSRADV